MGAPSPCRVSMPVTRVGGESGAFKSVVPCADQPPAAGEISNSSWPTVWPSSWMVNLPLSWAKTGAFFGAWEARETKELTAKTPTSAIANLISDFRGFHIVETLLCALRKRKFATAARRCAEIVRACAQSVNGGLGRSMLRRGAKV